jgi:hypothetical protein
MKVMHERGRKVGKKDGIYVILVVAIAFLGNGKKSFTILVSLVKEICLIDELVGSFKELVTRLDEKQRTAFGCAKIMSFQVKHSDKNTRLKM